jgi:small-conductance mechanosensitive channel
MVPHWLYAPIVFAAIVSAGLLIQAVVMRLIAREAKAWHPTLRLIFENSRAVGRFTLLVIAVAVALPLVPMSEAAQDSGHKLLVAAAILSIGWNVLVGVDVALTRYMTRYRIDTADNLLARKAVTQMRFMRRAIKVFIALVTVGIALMTFDTVRQFGLSLFASAGVAGIVAGLAAKPVLSNLFAGLQLAITQPIRVEDAVVINGEWGWVEEFTSTYVVIRLWDWRRQIVPLSYFFENVFTNWTRSSSSIIGSVFLYLDWTIPVERVRQKATEVVKASKLWDGQVVNLQVSDAKEETIELRILASASDSSRAWDLRCEVREKLIAFVQAEYPQCLPRQRPEVRLPDGLPLRSAEAPRMAGRALSGA